MSFFNTIKPYWQDNVQLHYMDTDSFALNFNTDHEKLLKFLKQKIEFGFTEIERNHNFYDPKKTNGKIKIATSPDLMLDSLIAL